MNDKTLLPLNRPRSPEMDQILGEPFSALDHGFIRLIDYMGDEAAIVQAARVSYGVGTDTPSSDVALIRYLMRHVHTTPFEMCEIKLHVKLPIFVARQWIRHRTANVNEYSARYSILTREFYVPATEDMQRQSKTNKQGRAGELPPDVAKHMQDRIADVSNKAFDAYADLLHAWEWMDENGEPYPPNEHGDDFSVLHEGEQGLTRELARSVLPLNAYTEWYWKVDVHNLLHFLKLRMDPHAQKEIRVYGEIIFQMLQRWMPNVCSAFMDYTVNAHRFSGMEMRVLRKMLDGRLFAVPDHVPEWTLLSGREKQEFMRAISG